MLRMNLARMISISRFSRIVSLNRISIRSYTNWPLLRDEHRMVADMCRQFADTKLTPFAGQFDKEHRYPKEQVEELGKLGEVFHSMLFYFLITDASSKKNSFLLL